MTNRIVGGKERGFLRLNIWTRAGFMGDSVVTLELDGRLVFQYDGAKTDR